MIPKQNVVRFHTGTNVSYRYENRSELVSVWLVPVQHFVPVSYKRIQRYKWAPEWTRTGMKLVSVSCKHSLSLRVKKTFEKNVSIRGANACTHLFSRCLGRAGSGTDFLSKKMSHLKRTRSHPRSQGLFPTPPPRGKGPGNEDDEVEANRGELSAEPSTLLLQNKYSNYGNLKHLPGCSFRPMHFRPDAGPRFVPSLFFVCSSYAAFFISDSEQLFAWTPRILLTTFYACSAPFWVTSPYAETFWLDQSSRRRPRFLDFLRNFSWMLEIAF